jgi:hypothetical protein
MINDIPRVTPKVVADWKTNYGLLTRSPKEASQYWRDQSQIGAECSAPAGAVAALGTAIQEIERLWAEQDDARTTIVGLESERSHYASERDTEVAAHAITQEELGKAMDENQRNAGLLDAVERIGTERDMLRDECDRRAKETGLYRRELGEMEIRLAGVESERDHYRAALKVAHDHDVLVSGELARLQAMRCETCRHQSMAVHVSVRGGVAQEVETPWCENEGDCRPCSYMGGGCRAWEGR